MKKKTIYLLEDDPDINEMIQYILSASGYKIISFFRVKDFKQQIAVALPDLFILDIMLPDGSGLAVCEELTSREPTSVVPVLLMSANLQNSVAYKQAGAWEFISKPFDIEELVGKVGKLVS